MSLLSDEPTAVPFVAVLCDSAIFLILSSEDGDPPLLETSVAEDMRWG